SVTPARDGTDGGDAQRDDRLAGQAFLQRRTGTFDSARRAREDANIVPVPFSGPVFRSPFSGRRGGESHGCDQDAIAVVVAKRRMPAGGGHLRSTVGELVGYPASE